MKQHEHAPDSTGGVESLYPFLYRRRSDRAAILEQVRRSTAEKICETVTLRDRLGTELALRLIACAEALAQRFAAGGRLFAFGNGGSATDAQAVAQLFLHPRTGQPLPAFSLTHEIAVITALANDIGFE